MLSIKNGKTVWILPATLVVGMMLLSACGGAAPAPTADPMDVPVVSSTQLADEDEPTVAAPATSEVVPTEETDGGAPATGGVSFKDDVMPILQSRCVKCHGGERTEKKFNLTSYEKLMAGGENGVTIVPGDAAASKLIVLVESGKMPKRSAKLLPDQIQILIDWINQGAQNN